MSRALRQRFCAGNAVALLHLPDDVTGISKATTARLGKFASSDMGCLSSRAIDSNSRGQLLVVLGLGALPISCCIPPWPQKMTHLHGRDVAGTRRACLTEQSGARPQHPDHHSFASWHGSVEVRVILDNRFAAGGNPMDAPSSTRAAHWLGCTPLRCGIPDFSLTVSSTRHDERSRKTLRQSRLRRISPFFCPRRLETYVPNRLAGLQGSHLN